MSEDIESVMSKVSLAVSLVEVSCSDGGGGEDVRILNVRSKSSVFPVPSRSRCKHLIV